MSIMPNPLKHPPFWLLEKIIDGAKKLWGIIKGKDKKQAELAEQKGIDPNKSKAEEISELNRLLLEYRSNISSAAESLEHDMIVECVGMIGDISDKLQELNESLKIVRVESVKRKFSRVRKELKGTFDEYVKKRISLDDAECLAALQLPAGELKNQRLQALKEKAFVEATNEIIERVKSKVDDFLDEMDDAFDEHLIRSEEKLTEKTEVFEKLSVSLDGDIQEEIMTEAVHKLAMCELAEEIIDSEELT